MVATLTVPHAVSSNTFVVRLRRPFLRTLLASSLLATSACAQTTTTSSASGAPAAPVVKGRLPERLHRMNHQSLNRAELVALSSLQGILAKESAENIYLDDGNAGYRIWLDLFRRAPHTEVVDAPAFRDTLARFQNKVAGYILCRAGDPRSLDIAVSLAGPARGVVMDESLQPVAESLGWHPLYDTRDKDFAWLETVRPAAAPADVLVVQPKELPWQLRDYAVLADAQAMPAWHTADAIERFQALARCHPNATLLGWGDNDKEDELTFISRSSKAGLPLIPANHVRNLSVLSSLPATGALKQKPAPADHAAASPAPSRARVHTVTFVFTDGDNLSWLLFDFPTDRRWYGSPARGEISLGWGMAPSLAELAPGVVDWYYQQAASSSKARDVFIAGPSGDGYFFPSHMPADALDRHCRELNRLMGAADLGLVQIIDTDALDRTDLWGAYLAQPNIDGLIYFDYAPYDKEHGRITWAHGKPVVSAAAQLWGGAKNSSPDAIVARLNKAARDSHSTRGYSLVVVHAWTHTAADVVALARRLDSGVEVVAPDEFFQRIRANLAPAPEGTE